MAILLNNLIASSIKAKENHRDMNAHFTRQAAI